jgi:hypothetical protein
MGGIVNPQCLPVLRKLAREFEVSERRRSNREQCRNNPDRPQHKDDYRALNVEHDLCPIGFFDSPLTPTKMPLGLSDLRMRIDVFLLISDVARRSAQALTNR